MRNYSEIFFIKVFFRILIAFFVLAAIVIVTFHVNDSVSFTTGEIMPENPQIDYKAAFDARPGKIMVKEGQSVKQGDTLIILINEQVRKNLQDAEDAHVTLQAVNNSISELIEIAKGKIKNLEEERNLNAQAQNQQDKKLTRDLNSASQKVELNKDKLTHVALTKLKMDSSLFKNQVISQLDMTNSYDSYLNYKTTLLESEYARDQIRSSLISLNNEYKKSQTLLDFKIISLQERLEELNKEKSASDKDLKSAIENLNYCRDEAAKQFIISTLDGEVINLFNVKYTQNFVIKNDLLVSVVPARDKFYARVMVAQRDVRYIMLGQDVNLKLDAFSVYESGILKGKVDYVPERKPKENFFVVIDIIPRANVKLKAGYSVKGEIIIERLKLYRFILKKLFRKFETPPREFMDVQPPAMKGTPQL